VFFYIKFKFTNMGHPNIKDRKLSFGWRLSESDLNNLAVECPECYRYFADCGCQRVCEYLQVVFTDGACSNNGRQGYVAKAGLGIVIGDDSNHSWSISVDDTLDDGPRTSQRTELLAAIEGLKKLDLHHDDVNGCMSSARHEVYRTTYIVVTDSEYVVEGITKWFPKWRVSCHSG
jgi:ribonuclease HI